MRLASSLSAPVSRRAHCGIIGQASSQHAAAFRLVAFAYRSFFSCLSVWRTVGILTATIVSAVWNTDHAAFLLPHAMFTIGLTVGMAFVVRILVS